MEIISPKEQERRPTRSVVVVICNVVIRQKYAMPAMIFWPLSVYVDLPDIPDLPFD